MFLHNFINYQWHVSTAVSIFKNPVTATKEETMDDSKVV